MVRHGLSTGRDEPKLWSLAFDSGWQSRRSGRWRGSAYLRAAFLWWTPVLCILALQLAWPLASGQRVLHAAKAVHRLLPGLEAEEVNSVNMLSSENQDILILSSTQKQDSAPFCQAVPAAGLSLNKTATESTVLRVSRVRCACTQASQADVASGRRATTGVLGPRTCGWRHRSLSTRLSLSEFANNVVHDQIVKYDIRLLFDSRILPTKL